MSRVVCGLLCLDGSDPAASAIDAMLEAMRRQAYVYATHEVVIDGPIALAVMTLGESSEAGTATHRIVRTERGVLAADVRLYGETDGSSDERKLAEYIERGPEVLATSHGDFAFAYWDRLRERLVLGRDHVGVRPIQYTIRSGRYAAFASLPSALLRTGLASRVLDDEVVASFPVRNQPFPGRTYFKHVHSLQAAHLLTVDRAGRTTTHRYWRLPLKPPLPLSMDPGQAAAELNRLLTQAVRRRLPSKGPGASHMSGGLDSTAIAILAARALREQGRRCLAYSYQESRDIDVAIVDEAPYVADAARSEPNLVVKAVTSPSPLFLCSHGFDTEIMFPLCPETPERTVLRDAVEHGASVVLSGWGGDQVVTSPGANLEFELFSAGRLRGLDTALRRRSRTSGRSVWREFMTHVGWGFLPVTWNAWVQRQRGLGMRPILDGEVFIAASKRPPSIYQAPLLYFNDRVRRRANLEDGWISRSMEHIAQLGSQYGIAYAFPMLDLDLLRYAIRLPAALFLREGIPRRLIRDAVEGILPESVRWRVEKLAPYPLEALRIAEEKPALTAALRELSQLTLLRDYVNMDAIVRHVERFDREQIRERIAKAAQNKRQPGFEDLCHQRAVALAYFLKAQLDIL